MEKYQDEAVDLLLKIHGQYATIEHNSMNAIFSVELDKEGIDINTYNELYDKVSEYYSQNYEENKEESDNKFVKETIRDMKRLMDIANMIE